MENENKAGPISLPNMAINSFEDAFLAEQELEKREHLVKLLEIFNFLVNKAMHEEEEPEERVKNVAAEFILNVNMVRPNAGVPLPDTVLPINMVLPNDMQMPPEMIAQMGKAVEVESLKRGDVLRWQFPGDSGVGVVRRILKRGEFTSNTEARITMEASESEPVIVLEELERVDETTYRRTGTLKPKRPSQVNQYRDVDIVKIFTEEELTEFDIRESLLELNNVGIEPVYSGKDMFFYTKDNELRFFGVYSNKYMDREEEILTEASHKDFVEAVDKDSSLLPSLQFWHIDKDLGQIKQLIWSDYGFVIFAGKVLDEYKDIVNLLLVNAKTKGVEMGCSHGFFVLERNGSIINKYRSKEISFLPLERAANLLTAFNVNG